jgi:PAS domain S-box-containing protein
VVEKITGHKVNYFLGKSNDELGFPEMLTRPWQDRMRSVFEQGREQTFEFTFESPQGLRHFENHMVPEFAADGRVQSILAICHDITERVRVHEQTQVHLAELAHATRLSTIGGLVSEIAHEINQPLHAISNYSQAGINVLEKMPQHLRSNLFPWLTQISEQTNRAAEIIRRATHFTRKAPVRWSTVSINELVRDCLKVIGYALRIHQVELHCDLSEDLPTVVADAIQIQQVVINLVRNGIEAMEETPPENRQITVATSYFDETVQVAVSDTGSGLPEENSVMLFEPFFTTKPDGLGLGLAVSQSIIQSHGGRLWMESNQSRGATFHFMLPLHRKEPCDVYCHT